MALINDIIKEAKKQKATTNTKVNKAAPAVTGLASKVASASSGASKASAGATRLSSKAQNYKPSSASGVTNILNKVKESQGKTLTPTGAKVNTGKSVTSVSKNKLNPVIDETLRKLRPQEETNKELDAVNKRLSIYDNTNVVNEERSNLEKRQSELLNEQKLQEEKIKRVTIPEYQKAYEEAMAKGDKEEAKRISEVIDAYDDNLAESLIRMGTTSFVNAANDMTLGAYDAWKDLSYEIAENDARTQAQLYRQSGDTQKAEQYQKAAEDLDKQGKAFNVNDPNNWSAQIRAETQRQMELSMINRSDSEKLLLDLDQGITHMLPSIVSGTGLVGMFAEVYSSSYAQNIAEGYDEELSAGNAVLHGANEVIWEIISPFSNAMQTSAVMNSHIGRVAAMTIGDPLGEAVEEIGTALVDPWIDKFTKGEEVEYNWGEIMMTGLMAMVQSEAMNVPFKISSHIETTRQVNEVKAEMDMLDQIASRPENVRDVNLQAAVEMAKRHGNDLINEFKSKSVLGGAITLESDNVATPNVNELLQRYEQFMQPTNNRYDQAVQQSVLRLSALQEEVLKGNGVEVNPDAWAIADSKTRSKLVDFAERQLDINYEEYIAHPNENYRKAMVDIAENNIISPGKKFNAGLYAALNNETQESVKRISKKFNNAGGVNVAFDFFKGKESGMNAKYDKANNAIVVNLNQTRAIDVDQLADIAEEAYKDFAVNDIFYKSGFASTFTNAVAHEFTHSAEGTDEYDKVVELAKQSMGAERFERAKERLNEYYESRDADPGDNSEIIAHYIQKNVDSEDFIEKLYKYNNSAFYRIYDNMLSLLSGNEKTRLESTLRKAIYKANHSSTFGDFGLQYSGGVTKRITDINDANYYTRSNLELGNPIEVVDYPKSNQQLSGKTDVKSFFDTMITNAVNSGATEYRRGLGAYFDVVNNDTGDKVGVTDNVVNEAIAHHGNTFVTSSLLNLKPVLENAVLVNKTTNGRDVFDVYFTHARFGGSDTLIRIIAKNSTVVDVDSMAYAVSTSRGDSALVTKNSTLPSSGKKNGGVFDTITIANLLQEVNKTRFRGNLSKDVQSSLNSGVVIPNPDPRYTNLYSIGLDSNQKQTQFDILQSANPMTDDYHTGIRSVDDIHTFEEVNQSMEDVTPDFTAEDIRQAIDDGYVTVYSSNPIQNGTFVTPSLMEAKNYAGDGKIYSQRVSLDQVAWIDSVEGQYADTSNYEAEQFSKEEIDLKPLTQEKPYNISKNTVQFSVGMYEHGGREVLEDYIKNNPDIEGGEDIVKRVDEIAQVMKDFAETGKYPSFSKWQDQYYAINEKGELSVVISNGDYDLNIDFSTVCKKRKMMDKVINRLSESGYLDATLRPDMIAEVRKTIQDRGMEVACGLCFVDAKRFNQGNWAGRFESKWNGLIDQLAGIVDTDDVRTFDYVRGQTQASESLANIDFSDPRFAEFVEKSKGSSEEAKMARALINDPSLRAYVSRNDMYGSEGFSSIRDNNPELYKLVNASGGSSKPKLAHGEVNFRNEIILDNGFNEQAAREVGGVRFQSFSDFMTNMVFDYVQAFSELEAKHLPAHSYTKVKEYALLFGKTGMKINLSIIPAAFDSKAYTAEEIADMRKNNKKEFARLRENAGLDADGNYIFDPESFDWDLAVEISNLDGYDKNVGTICVGVSYNHIVKMLGDSNVQMVIPYHRSGINPIVADKMGISLYNDYTLKQNTRFRKENGKPGKKVGKSFDFDFYKGKDANGKHYPGMIELGYDAKAATDSYLKWCEDSNYVPKFDEFAWHENYYKLLIDFRAYDKYGNVAPQEAVKISGDNFGSFGEALATDMIDPQVNPKLAELYGDNISFNNILKHGLELNESIEYEQDSQLDEITNEVINKLKLKPKYSIGIDSQGRQSTKENYEKIGDMPLSIQSKLYGFYKDSGGRLSLNEFKASNPSILDGTGLDTLAKQWISNYHDDTFGGWRSAEDRYHENDPYEVRPWQYSMGLESAKPEGLDISDEEFARFVKRDPISPKSLERIEKYKSQLTETAKEWIPNYDIIQEKHPEFTERELNDALFEILSEGTISESTANRIKDNLVQGLGVSSYAEANQSVKELVDDALDYFKADASYKMDKKAMNSVANKANTEIRSFTGNTASEGALDSYAKFENLEKTLEQVKKRRKAVAAENESMVKELIAAGTDYDSYSWMTLEQNLDKIAGTDSNLRQTLKDYFELPKYQSQIEYVQFLQKYGDTLQGLVKDGIRAGTKESAAVQYMLEGHTEDGATYTQKDLMTQFPKTWQKLDKAAKTLRGMYDEMYNLIESGRERTYGDIDAKYDLLMAKAREKANNARRTANELRQKLSEKADPKLEAMYNQANAEAEKLQRQYEQMVNDKASGDGTRRQKLQYRQNYAHHIYDRGGLSSFVDALMEDGSKVPTKLSGISNRAKPLSGFASFFQRQSKQKGYVADAIGGMSAYITDAAKIYAYDPYIEYLRFAANDIRLEASGNEMSRFVSWVDNYANGIAGKTQMLDRGIRETFGEKPLNMIRTLNNQARKNAIVGNLSTALVQFANLPNAIGVLSKNGGAESALDIARGMTSYMSHLGRDGAESMSPFMNARYYDINTQKGNALTRSANALARTLLEFGDHEAAKMIWNSAYQQALRKNVEDPIMYADDLTRRSIAGRSVGELPLAMESQVINLLMPFQVETNNTFHLMTGLLRDKEWGSALAMLIGGWLMNGLYEAIIGRRPITDPIDALIDANKSDNPMDVFTRLGGELLSAVPGSSYAVGLFGLDDNQRKKLFGENDPSRYGTGNIGLSAIGSALSDMYNYTEKRDPRYAMNATSDLFFNYVTPGGGRQMQRSIEGLQSEGMIPQYVNGEWVSEPRYYTPSGKVGFVNDPSDIFDVITAGTFGRWATKSGKEYLENGGKYLSSEAQRQLEALGGDYDAYNTVQALRDIKGVPNVKNSQALARRKYLEDQGLWDTFSSNMEGEWGDYGLNKTVGNATEEEFNELYREAFGANISNAAKPDTKKEVDLSGLAGTPLERVAIQNLDMDEDVLQGVTDLGYDYKTIKQIDDYIDNTDSLRKEDGSAIRNTKALQMRQQYEELGVYDDIFEYISENGLDPQDYGLNKTVMGYSDSKFDSQYSKYFGGSSGGSSSKKSSGRKSSKSSKKSSKKTQAEKDQAFFDKLVAQIGTSGSTSSAIKSILKKNKSLRKSSKGNSYEGLQDLIKSYYKAHPGADKSMFS